MSLVETIRKTIERYELIPEGKRIVLGVSGGADSVALLRIFQQLNIPVTAAHLNHQLRGSESDADEAFVRSLGVPTVIKSVDVKTLAETTGQSIEMAARQARLDFFAEFEDAVIALAHHADDQVETFILKLARGAGTEGLCGMPPRQQIGPINLIRPMLSVSRNDILHWLKENNFEWREDSSNTDETYLRNKVRHTILPLLGKELNPNIRETILRTMDILREENAYIDAASSPIAQARDSAGTMRLEAASTRSQPLALQRRTVRKWLIEQGAERIDFEAVEQILKQMAAAEGSTVYELNSRQRVVVEYGEPRFESVEQIFQPALPVLTTQRGNGWIKDESRIGEFPAAASVSAQKVGHSALTVRNWHPGDRMAPLGMNGTRKLQDILTDLKVPKAQRKNIPVVVCRGEIIWIPGYRIARDWKLKSDTDKAIHLKLEQNRTE